MSFCTVIIINYARPANVALFAEQYAAMPRVGAVLIADCKPFDRGSPVISPKVMNLVCHPDPGLTIRFAAASLVRNGPVLFVDDDIELPERTVNTIFDVWQAGHPDRVVGIFGRQPSPEGKYSIATYHGHVPIVLTRAAMTSRGTAVEALHYMPSMVSACGGEPYGNGEDILLSYVATMRSQQPNLAINLQYRNKDFDDANAISVRYKQHEEHRSRVVQWCQLHVWRDPE